MSIDIPQADSRTPSSSDHIVCTPGTLGGKPRVAGRRISVECIAVSYEDEGKTAKQIAAEYDLTLEQVDAALAYYNDHRDEIRARQREGAAFAEKVGSAQPSLMQSAAAKIRAKLGASDPSSFLATLSSGSILAYLQSDLCPAEQRELIRADLPRRLAANPIDPDTFELQIWLGLNALEGQS